MFKNIPLSEEYAIAANANPEEGTYWKIDYRYYDQYTLEEVQVDHIYGRYPGAKAADKLLRMNYDIHTGAILGLPGKILAFLASLLCASLPLLSLSDVDAQFSSDPRQDQEKNQHDSDFPGRKKINVGVMATYTNIAPPPAVIADATYSLSNRLSVGIMAGTTGTQLLTGVKFNARILQKNTFRILYRMVIVYYPGRKGEFLFDHSDKRIIPWMLSMAAVDAEWRTANGIRWSIGMGVLETHCIIGMRRFFWGSGEEEKIVPFEFSHPSGKCFHPYLQ